MTAPCNRQRGDINSVSPLDIPISVSTSILCSVAMQKTYDNAGSDAREKQMLANIFCGLFCGLDELLLRFDIRLQELDHMRHEVHTVCIIIQPTDEAVHPVAPFFLNEVFHDLSIAPDGWI